MFKQNNPHGLYPNHVARTLTNAELLYFGLLASGAVKLESIPTPKVKDERCFIDQEDGSVMEPLIHDLALLSDLFEQCRRFAARKAE